MTDVRQTRPVDLSAMDDAAALLGGVVESERVVCLPRGELRELAQAIVAMANSRGGVIIVGAHANEEGQVIELPGIEGDALASIVGAAADLVDPPVTHLLQQRVVPAGSDAVGVIQVRLSPSAPHLVTADGGVYRLGQNGVQPIRSRRALDDLYARGRGERERADRLVEAMIEKLTLSHYAFYSLAVIACTHVPSGEAYRNAQTEPSWLAPPDDPFIAAFALHEHEARVGPGEIELRTPGEVNAFVRVTRTGCVAAGEVQRRPYHEELDTAASLEARVARLVQTTARLLAVAPDTLMLPHLFVEGVRGLRLLYDPAKRLVSGNAPQDTARHPLTVGDARDPTYLAALPAEAMARMASLFP